MIAHAPSKVNGSPQFSTSTTTPRRLGYEFDPVPKAVRRMADLSGDAKILFGVLINMARFRAGVRVCTASNEMLAEETGRSIRKIQRDLTELENAGLIRRRYGDSLHVRKAVEIVWAAPESNAATTAQHGASNPSHYTRDQGQVVRQNCHTPVPNLSYRGTSDSTHIKEETQTKDLPEILSLDSGGEDQESKPSPSEIAEALRAMLGGSHASAMFEATETGPTGVPRATPAINQLTQLPNQPPSPAGQVFANASSSIPCDPKTLALRITLPARRAAWGPLGGRRRKPLQVQLAELSKRRPLMQKSDSSTGSTRCRPEPEF